jgi:nucleoside-diphosphate-sugar epimerase
MFGVFFQLEKISNISGNEGLIGDMVPVDVVANAILVAIPALKNQLQIYHIGTSDENPIR